MSCSSSRKQILSYAHGGRNLAKLGLNQTLTENKKEVSRQSKITKNGLFPSTSQVSKSEVKIVEAARRMVKSKEDSCSNLVIKTESIMASKTCPICKVFSSASNTTLNAHIDHCLSVDSGNQPTSKPNRPRVKSRMRFKSIVDIYASAKRCTLEDLDRRNGTQWASISSYSNQAVADKSEVSKKRKVSSSDVGLVYVDAKGQKSRILSEFNKKKTSTTPSRKQHEDGISEKKGLSQGNNTCLRKSRQGNKLAKCKTDVSEQIPEYQRKVSGEGRSTGHRRIYNQRMLAKGSLISKKQNENALGDQPSDKDDYLCPGGTSSVLRGTDLPATYSYHLKKQKLHSEVARRNKTLSESKRAQSLVRMNEKEESLERVHSNTLRLKKSIASIQEDKYATRKRFFSDSVETSDASHCANSLRKVSPPFVANAWRRLSLELKKTQVDFSENEDEEETRKRESEMTQEHNDDYVYGDNGERNEILLRSNPSSSGYSDYNDDDEEESSEEEEDNNERASELAKTNNTGAEFTSEPLLIYGQAASEEDVRFDSKVGQRSLFIEVDTIPIPGPPGSFIPSPRDMWFDENLGNSSIITSQVQSSIDQLDRNSSESPVSAVSNFAARRLNFPTELSSSFRDNFSSVSYSTASTSFCIPSHHGTITEPERISESITLNHQASNLLQRRAASSSITMNLTKPPDPNHPFDERSQYKIQQDLDLQSRFSTRKGTVPPSPSYSVVRLMGKDLMIMNQGEANPDLHCAETESHFNTDLHLRNSFESAHQPHEPQAEASGFRNNFDQVRYFSP